MNTLGIALVWIALQVSAFCALGALVYLAARRRNPATGAWTVAATLAVALGITALAVSPWPRLWSVAGPIRPDIELDSLERDVDAVDSPTTDTQRAAVETEPLISPTAGDRLADDAEAGASPSRTRGGWRAFLAGLQADISRPSSGAEASSAWRWPAWLAAGMLLACGLGMARLAVALVALASHRQLTRAVADPAMLSVLDEIRAALGCVRPIELREAAALCSPSTIGWLRPVVILPGDWRAWTAQDRRAVLAHEVAHVARGDFASCLAAQLGVALHFYNPLVHWLAARLRLEQEMAADCCGARVAGGRQRYLTTLAQMALRHDGPALSWAARPFLPARGALMRRIEMLHQQTTLPNVSLTLGRRALVALALVAAGLLVAGVRGPGEVAAAPPNQAGEKFVFTGLANPERAPISLDFMHPDAQVVLALRPAELIKLKGLEKLAKTLEQLGAFEALGLPLADLEEFKMASGGTPGPLSTNPDQGVWRTLVFRSTKRTDWSKLISSQLGPVEAAQLDGHEILKRKTTGPALYSACWRPDERTIVFARAEWIARTFALQGEAHRPAWADQWNKVARGPAAARFTPSVLQEVVDHMPRTTSERPNVKLAELLKFALVSSGVADGRFQVDTTFECTSPQAAKTVAGLIEATFQQLRNNFAQANKGGPAVVLEASGLPKFMLGLVDATKIEVDASTVQTRTTVSPEIGDVLTRSVGPARAAAQRNRAVNNMKQIAIALLNYHDTYRHFPPAVVIGPDGKTPHSWRVELLPFFDRKDLYDRYKMDEPWDSENNKKIIAEGAEIFSVPGDKPDSDCGFFVLTGPGTVFDPSQPPCKIRNITDGTSKTICVVEAKRAIPWTRPEDIEYSPDKPLPKLGGFFEGGFHMSLVDGSVRFYPSDFDEKTMRAMISRAGREVITYDNATQLPALQK